MFCCGFVFLGCWEKASIQKLWYVFQTCSRMDRILMLQEKQELRRDKVFGGLLFTSQEGLVL